MAIKIGIVNQKGGVGKTTTAICLTDAFTQIGYKTLLIDFDPQANSSSVFNVTGQENTIYEGILKRAPMKDIIIKGNPMGDIIPSKTDLAKAAAELITGKAGDYKLSKAITLIEDEYDMIVVDSGPTAGIMMDNVLAAVDGVVIPMEAEKFSIDGLQALLANIDEAREDLNPKLSVYGVLLTKFNKEMGVQKEIAEDFEKLDENIVHKFKTKIRLSAAIPRTQGFMAISNPRTMNDRKTVNSQGSIYNYGINNGSLDYSAFAKELQEVIANG